MHIANDELEVIIGWSLVEYEKPRYLPNDEVAWMERLAVSASMWSDLKLEEKKTMELVRLIFSPDTSLKGVQSMDDCVTILGVNSCKYS